MAVPTRTLAIQTHTVAMQTHAKAKNPLFEKGKTLSLNKGCPFFEKRETPFFEKGKKEASMNSK